VPAGQLCARGCRTVHHAAGQPRAGSRESTRGARSGPDVEPLREVGVDVFALAPSVRQPCSGRRGVAARDVLADETAECPGQWLHLVVSLRRRACAAGRLSGRPAIGVGVVICPGSPPCVEARPAWAGRICPPCVALRRAGVRRPARTRESPPCRRVSGDGVHHAGRPRRVGIVRSGHLPWPERAVPGRAGTADGVGENNRRRGGVSGRRERVTGIEPAPPVWKTGALPLSYTRGARSSSTVDRAP
jgi:hypothetical protein